MGLIRATNRREALLSRLRDRLNLNGESDSPIAVLAEVLGSEIETVENEIYDYFYRNNISTSSEEDLETLASSDYDTNRRPATRASSAYFYFYTDTTFGDINGGDDIVIPEGTLLGMSNPVSNSEVIFETKEQIVLRADLEYSNFYAESRSTGSSQNVNVDTIRFHNFTNYTSAAQNLLRVSNNAPITNGSDREVDQSLRTRCVGRNQRQVERNKNYIFLSLLEESSVFSFDIIESYFGIGTVGVIVRGNGNNEVDDEKLQEFQDLIATEVKHLGQKVIFSKGLKVVLDLDISLQLTNQSLTQVEIANMENEIRSFVFREIKNQEVSKVINWNSIQGRVLDNFSVQINSRANSMYTSVTVSKEDTNVGAPEVLILNKDNSLVIENDEFIGEINISVATTG